MLEYYTIPGPSTSKKLRVFTDTSVVHNEAKSLRISVSVGIDGPKILANTSYVTIFCAM